MKIFDFLISLLNLFTKAIPSDKQREVNQEEKKPVTAQEVKIQVQKLKGKELEEAIELHKKHPQISGTDFQKMIDGEITIGEVVAKYSL